MVRNGVCKDQKLSFYTLNECISERKSRYLFIYLFYFVGNMCYWHHHVLHDVFFIAIKLINSNTEEE